MQKHYVLDTHAFDWFLMGKLALSRVAKAAILDQEALLYFPSLCMLEAFNMVRKGRTTFTTSQLVDAIRTDPRMTVLPLDQVGATIGGTLEELTGLHDRAIVASTMQLGAETPVGEVWLVTKDREIHKCGRVKVLW